ncbi:MAG: hypothetical protein IID41_17670, partial [Planctomycetes bacterium]|nr:hypothetical protein [Planctomycetota bacterium]
MPNDSKYKSRPWTMTFRVPGEPRCPGCCIKLASVVITFAEGWAWCPVCTQAQLHANNHLRYVMHHDVMTRCSVMSHGLRFFFPQTTGGNLHNAIDEYERLINDPEEAPKAIAAWPGFSLEQLPQHVRDRSENLNVRFCRHVRVPFGYEIAGIADDGRLVLLEIEATNGTAASPHPHS